LTVLFDVPLKNDFSPGKLSFDKKPDRGYYFMPASRKNIQITISEKIEYGYNGGAAQ